MSLYEVRRTDMPEQDEFVSGLVRAAGSRQAKLAVGHLEGVTADNLEAVRVLPTGPTEVLSVYFAESD